MGNRSSMRKFCLLFFIAVAFIVLPGLSTHFVTTVDVSYVLAEEVEEESAEEILEEENELTEESTDSDEKVDSQTNEEPTEVKKESEKKEAVKKDTKQDVKEDKREKEQSKVEEDVQDKPKESMQFQTNEATIPDMEWGAEHFELINYPEPVRAEDHPAFTHSKQTAIFSNSDFFYNSSLTLGGETNPNYPEVNGIYVDNGSYVYLGGGIYSLKDIKISNHSKVCSDGSITAHTGKLEISNDSSLYLNGSLDASIGNISIDKTSKIYIKEGTEVEGNVDLAENLIELSQVEFDYERKKNCFYDPGELEGKPGGLKALKSANKSTVSPGEEFEYTITVLNEKMHPETIKNITIEDELPEGLSFIENTLEFAINNIENKIENPDFEVDNQKIRVKIVELEETDIAYITFKVKLAEGFDGEEIKNVAIVDYVGNPNDSLKPETTVSVIPYSPFKITKEVDKSRADIEDELFYTIKVRNTERNGKTIENLMLTDNIPDGVDLITNDIRLNDQPVHDIGENENIELTIDELQKNEVAVLTFRVKVTEDAGEVIINKATVKDQDGENVQTAEAVTVIRPKGELEATKSVNKNLVRRGEVLEYTIEVTNKVVGSQPVTDVEIKDDLPKGITMVPDSLKLGGQPLDVDVHGNILVEILGIEAGEIVTLTFEAEVDEGAVDEVTNIAIITDPSDSENSLKPSATVEIVEGILIEKTIEGKKTPYQMQSMDDEFTWRVDVDFGSEVGEGWEAVVLSDVINESLDITNVKFIDHNYLNEPNKVVAEFSPNPWTNQQQVLNLGTLKVTDQTIVLFEFMSGDNNSSYLANKRFSLEIVTKLNKERVDELQGINDGIPNVGKLILNEDASKETNKVFVKLPETTMEITKVDADDGSRLSGAEFELRKCEEADKEVPCEKMENGRTLSNGKLTFKDVPLGTYQLVETKAPSGYNLLTKPIEVEITEIGEVKEITVKNNKAGWQLPDSGGVGTVLFYGVGAALMLGSLYFIFRKKKED